MSLVIEYLNARGVPYEVIHHDPSMTSLEEASAVAPDADHVLKAVVIATRGGHAVAVIPASRRFDMHLVRKALDDPSAYLATERELQGSFPSIELGGAPVLGWLLDAETLVDSCVLERDSVVFAAGTRTESVRVRTRDLLRGEHAAFLPLVAEPKWPRWANDDGGRATRQRADLMVVDGLDGAMRAVWWSVGASDKRRGRGRAREDEAMARDLVRIAAGRRCPRAVDQGAGPPAPRVPTRPSSVAQDLRGSRYRLHARTIASSASPPPSQSGRWGLGRTTHPGRDSTADGLQGLSCELS